MTVCQYERCYYSYNDRSYETCQEQFDIDFQKAVHPWYIALHRDANSYRSEQSFLSFETGATGRANLETTSSEIVPISTNTDNSAQTSVLAVNGVAKIDRPWKKFSTVMRRRSTLHQTSDQITPSDSESNAPPNMPQSQESRSMVTLPELPQRKSLTEELNVLPKPETDETVRPATRTAEDTQRAPGTNEAVPTIPPPKYTPKVCTKCGKRKRPKLVARDLSVSQNVPKPRTTLAVIAEAPVEPAPLLSPTTISDTSTLCAPDPTPDEAQLLQKSLIHSVEISSDFDAKHLVPDEIQPVPPRCESGLSFMINPMQTLSEERDSPYVLADDELEDDGQDDTLVVPDTAALDEILRDMQDLLNRTNAKPYSMSDFDFRASPVPREIV